MLDPSRRTSPRPAARRARHRRGRQCRRRHLRRPPLARRRGPPRRARRRQSLRRREIACLRLFDGQRSATVASSDLVRRVAWRRWSSAAWRWRARRPRIPMPGSRPPSCCETGTCPTIDSLATRSSPTPPIFASARLEPKARRSPFQASPIRAERAQSPRAVIVALATSGGFAGAYRLPATAARASVIAGEGATDAARPSPGTASRYLADLDWHRADRPTRRGARGCPAQPGAHQARALIRCCSIRGSRPACSAISRRRSAASAVARETSFLKDRLGEQVFAPGVTIIDDPLRPRGLALAPVRWRRAARRAACALVADGTRLTQWIAESAVGAAARHRSRPAMRRAAAAARRAHRPAIFHGTRARAAAKNCSPPSPKRCW